VYGVSKTVERDSYKKVSEEYKVTKIAERVIYRWVTFVFPYFVME